MTRKGGTMSMDARLGICSTLEMNRFVNSKDSFFLSATLTFIPILKVHEIFDPKDTRLSLRTE